MNFFKKLFCSSFKEKEKEEEKVSNDIPYKEKIKNKIEQRDTQIALAKSDVEEIKRAIHKAFVDNDDYCLLFEITRETHDVELRRNALRHLQQLDVPYEKWQAFLEWLKDNGFKYKQSVYENTITLD